MCSLYMLNCILDKLLGTSCKFQTHKESFPPYSRAEIHTLTHTWPPLCVFPLSGISSILGRCLRATAGGWADWGRRWSKGGGGGGRRRKRRAVCVLCPAALLLLPCFSPPEPASLSLSLSFSLFLWKSWMEKGEIWGCHRDGRPLWVQDPSKLPLWAAVSESVSRWADGFTLNEPLIHVFCPSFQFKNPKTFHPVLENHVCWKHITSYYFFAIFGWSSWTCQKVEISI